MTMTIITTTTASYYNNYYRPMSTGVDEIKTAMYSSIDNVTSVQAGLILKILLILGVDVRHNRLVAMHRDTEKYTPKYIVVHKKRATFIF